MTFLSILYGLFLLSTIGLYWAVETRSLRLWVLVVASVLFYCSQQIQYVPMMLGMALITYFIGRAFGTPMDWRISDADWQFAQQDWNRRRRSLLTIGILLNLLLLLGFKYVPFGLESLAAIAKWITAWLPAGLKLPEFNSIAASIREQVQVPLGISFFSFECIAYLIDVYRGAPPAQQFLPFAAYKFFFPKLISGPITRFHPLDAQLESQQFPAPAQIAEGLWLMACGAIKKLLIADHLGRLVGLIFDAPERAGSGDLWLAVFAYGLQLYLDFSAYVDVARGSAMLLGFDLPQNFNFPYLCTNIADFWRRWHMTLGDWLRNYLYFPLGGSRQGLWRTCLNLVIVMLIAGIWHGAAWGYVVWGGLHGLALVIHRLTDGVSKRSPLLQKWWSSLPGIIVAWGLTQFMVFTTWIFFRLPNLEKSNVVLQRLWGQVADIQFTQKIYRETLQSDRVHISLLLGAIGLGMGVAYALHRQFKVQFNWWLKLLLVPGCLYLAWLLAPNESPPYIYFDF
jgi:alginate O-acetyltransferase complex protein AlgI